MMCIIRHSVCLKGEREDLQMFEKMVLPLGEIRNQGWGMDYRDHRELGLDKMQFLRTFHFV